MNAIILFEYPLNEKIRTWLRVEFLINQLQEIIPLINNTNALNALRLISELLNISERTDIRIELLKELEKQQQKLQHWINIPGVDTMIVNVLRDKLKEQSIQLTNSPRIGQELREDRLISLVRQRLNIPGGCCSFDIPILHIWLHQSQSIRDTQINSWLETLIPMHNALKMIFDLIRQSGKFRTQTSINGFYQNNVENADLLRLQLQIKDFLYPQISGYRNRYSIRFIPFDKNCNAIPEKFDFELAYC